MHNNWFSSEITDHIVNFDNVVVIYKYDKAPFYFGQGVVLVFEDGTTIDLYCEKNKIKNFYNEIKTFLSEFKGESK